jgi:hypothetical protein
LREGCCVEYVDLTEIKYQEAEMGRVYSTNGKRNAYRTLAGKPEGNKYL